MIYLIKMCVLFFDHAKKVISWVKRKQSRYWALSPIKHIYLIVILFSFKFAE